MKNVLGVVVAHLLRDKDAAGTQQANDLGDAEVGVLRQHDVEAAIEEAEAVDVHRQEAKVLGLGLTLILHRNAKALAVLLDAVAMLDVVREAEEHLSAAGAEVEDDAMRMEVLADDVVVLPRRFILGDIDAGKVPTIELADVVGDCLEFFGCHGNSEAGFAGPFHGKNRV